MKRAPIRVAFRAASRTFGARCAIRGSLGNAVRLLVPLVCAFALLQGCNVRRVALTGDGGPNR